MKKIDLNTMALSGEFLRWGAEHEGEENTICPRCGSGHSSFTLGRMSRGRTIAAKSFLIAGIVQIITLLLLIPGLVFLVVGVLLQMGGGIKCEECKFSWNQRAVQDWYAA